jgi:uncharacterized protein (TIGR03382 family)
MAVALPIEITYHPTVERGPTDFDSIVLTTSITGAIVTPQMPATANILVKGRGIDRNLMVTAMPTFPDTFRNPGTAPTVGTLTVHNTGEATLKVTAVMIVGGPVWQLTAPAAAVDIPGNASHDFAIAFSPDALGPAPTGQLTLTTNDDHNITKVFTLTGTGVARDVAFGPAPGENPAMIDLGITGLGIPLTVDLPVSNMDMTTEFTIHALGLDDSSAFHLDTVPVTALPAGRTEHFTVTFDPQAPGDFTTLASLYLDQDPTPHGQVRLTGHAVFVEAHGSGGCDAGGTGAGGGLVLGLAALGALRRRRRPTVVRGEVAS